MFQNHQTLVKNKVINVSALLYLLVLILISYVAFYPSLFNNFYLQDDPVYIRAIKEWSAKEILSLFLSPFEGYHPLTLLTLSLNFHISGWAPFAYHLTNLFFHITNALLIFSLLSRLFNSYKFSFFVAMCFAIHPIQVEAVAWVASRKDLQYTFFYLLSLHFYLTFLKKKKYLSVFLTWLTFLLSLFSKGAAITLPFSLLVIDYLHGRNLKNIKPLVEKIPFLLLSISFAFINYHAQIERGYVRITDNSLFSNEKILSTFFYLFLYLRYFFVPYGLCAYHPYEPLETSQKIIAIVMMIFVICLFWFISKKGCSRIIIGGIFFFLIHIALGLQFLTRISTFAIAERYFYLACVGISMVIGYYLIFKLPSKLHWPILVLLISIMAHLTFSQCQTWQDTLTITSNILKFHPNAVYALEMRAGEYIWQKNYTQAAIDLDKAINRSPYKYELYRLRSILNAYMEKKEEAFRDIDIAISLAPSNSLLYYTRGTLYLNASNYSQAISNYKIAAKLGSKEALLKLKELKKISE